MNDLPLSQIAFIRMAHGPLNVLSHVLRKQIVTELRTANADPEIRAIVLTGSARAFSAGADIAEFGKPAAFFDPDLRAVISEFERSPKPVIAAIRGLALGGGLELALGAQGRVAEPGALLALPEIKLGIIPGAGGTQRATRGAGVDLAAQMILTGDTLPAARFAGTALIDLLTEDAEAGAIALARQLSSGEVKPVILSRLAPPSGTAEALDRLTARYADASDAHRAAVAAMTGILGDPEAGLALESAQFDSVYDSPAAVALRHAFLIEKKIVNPVKDVAPSREIARVGVVGSGTMGRGIALAIAQAGLPVMLHDSAPDALTRAIAAIGGTLDKAVAKGRQTRDDADEVLARIQPTADLEPFRSVDLAIEAVFEDMAVKRAVFARLDAVLASDALLATNTSALDVDILAAETKDPGRVVGLHFFSPANIMRLLEVVRGAATRPDVLSAALAFARRLRKVPVVSGVCDGFIGNRMINPYLDEAMWLLEDGVSPARIDSVIEAWGMAMGPFRMMDMAGTDIAWAVRKRRYVDYPDKPIPRIADQICEAGRMGQKTGRGFYIYPDGFKAVRDPEVEAMFTRWNAEKGNAPRDVADQEILDRLLLALGLEGTTLLAEGIALSADDIDAVYLFGFGFPKDKGGPMFWLRQQGAERVAAMLDRIRQQANLQNSVWDSASIRIPA